jgi:hypothetical protein
MKGELPVKRERERESKRKKLRKLQLEVFGSRTGRLE